MTYVFLDGERVNGIEDLHRAFAEALDLPQWYGKNLDALHDCLTDRTAPICVVAANTALLKKNLGRRWSAFLRLTRDLEQEMPGFRFADLDTELCS